MDEDELVAPQTVRAVEALVAAVPELAREWDEHLAFDGGALPHMFMGDVRTFAINSLPRADAELRRRFAMAINRLSGSEDHDVVNLVAVSFFEGLVGRGPGEVAALEGLRPWLSDTSLAIARSFGLD